MENNKKLLEVDINNIISNTLKDKYFVLQQLRIPPAELDIVAFDYTSLHLINIEIKRNNWKKVLRQAIRGQIYCHYSIAVLPMEMIKTVDVESFREQGIGLVFYDEFEGKINLDFAVEAMPSEVQNRSYKMLLYRHFHTQYGSQLYA